MGDSLQKRMDALVREVFAVEPGAWLVWCDPRGDWLPLLQRVAADQRMGGFDLMVVTDEAAGSIGSPVARRDVQAKLEEQASFVLYIPKAKNALGWLWGQALLAERIYARSLRSQLMDWGWRPSSLTQTDDEVAALARSRLQQDPSAWESGGLQPDNDKLLDVLAGLADPSEDDRFVLQVTLEKTGLPEIKGDDLDGWRREALARLLVTQAHAVAPEVVPEGRALLVVADARQAAGRLLDRWMDSARLAAALPESVTRADPIAALASAVSGLTGEAGPFASRAAEYAVFANTCNTLAQHTGKALLEALAALRDDLERHAQGFWGHRLAGQPQAVPWGELQRLSHAAAQLLDGMPQKIWSNPAAAISWYTGGGWRMDRAGAAITQTLSVSDPALVKLIAPLRNAFVARWEETLIRWSQVWAEAGCPVPKLPTAGTWLKAALDNSASPAAVLVVDALRYDLAATLVEWVNVAEQVERAEVVAARSPLPSITAVGMAAALPVDERALVADLAGGKWQVRLTGADANLSVAEERRKWWTMNYESVRCVSLAEFLSSPAPKPSTELRRLVIHDATIDKLGHDDELEWQGGDQVLKRYHTAIERLRDQGWRRIFVVTDHGFIHWTRSDEKNASPPVPDFVAKPDYKSRRALAYAPTLSLEGPRGLTPGGKWQVALPYGAAGFSAYGGQGYFHGGASLQEWIIPCIKVEWPAQAKPVQVVLQPTSQILRLNQKIGVDVVVDNLLLEESIPRQIEVVVRHGQTRVILFDTQIATAQPNRSPMELTLSAKEGVAAERGTPLVVELRDPNTEDVLDRAESKLMIELTEW